MRAMQQDGLVRWVYWYLQQRRRRRAGGEQVPLPQLAHHPGGGAPGEPLHDDIYLAENPGAVTSDTVELWILDPSIETVSGLQPTEAEWGSALRVFVSYSEAMGRWHFETSGEGKDDGDIVWVRGRFVRAGEAPGLWSLVDYFSGAGMAVWQY